MRVLIPSFDVIDNIIECLTLQDLNGVWKWRLPEKLSAEDTHTAHVLIRFGPRLVTHKMDVGTQHITPLLEA